MYRNRILRYAPLVLAAGAAFMAPSASACPQPSQAGAALAPSLAESAVRARLLRLSANSSPSRDRPARNSFTGLWQVTYSTGGSLWDMSFDSWHSDGTENDNDMSPPSISAVCEGVWEWVGFRTVKLHHVGWSWNSTGAVLLGTFSLDETNTLGADGDAYIGTFTYQAYDLNGNPMGSPTKGTIAAARITADD